MLPEQPNPTKVKVEEKAVLQCVKTLRRCPQEQFDELDFLYSAIVHSHASDLRINGFRGEMPKTIFELKKTVGFSTSFSYKLRVYKLYRKHNLMIALVLGYIDHIYSTDIDDWNSLDFCEKMLGVILTWISFDAMARRNLANTGLLVRGLIVKCMHYSNHSVATAVRLMMIMAIYVQGECGQFEQMLEDDEKVAFTKAMLAIAKTWKAEKRVIRPFLQAVGTTRWKSKWLQPESKYEAFVSHRFNELAHKAQESSLHFRYPKLNENMRNIMKKALDYIETTRPTSVCRQAQVLLEAYESHWLHSYAQSRFIKLELCQMDRESVILNINKTATRVYDVLHGMLGPPIIIPPCNDMVTTLVEIIPHLY